MQTMVVKNADDIVKALKTRVRHIKIQVPAGKTFEQFLAEMVVKAKTEVPDMAAYDGYEIESIIREMDRKP